RYGYFRDPLYYPACSRHLAWGYVDHPPLIALVTWTVRHTLGISLPALLLAPALAGAARILLAGAVAGELGAGGVGAVLAAGLSAIPGVYLGVGRRLAMAAFEAPLWTGLALILLVMIRTNDPRLWVGFGLVAGIGLENKYSIAVWAFALLAGLVVSPRRGLLMTPWLVAGGATALALFLPNL